MIRHCISATHRFIGSALLTSVLLFLGLGYAQQSVLPKLTSVQPAVSFLPAVGYDTGGSEAGFVAVADVNGDGKMDLLVANTYFSNTIAVLLGKGDGTFQPAVTYPSGGGFPVTIVPIDVNGDGKLDLVVANQSKCYTCTGGGIVAVLLGNGDGSFKPATTYHSGGEGFDNSGIGPAELAVVDVNADGKLDIVVNKCGPLGSCDSTQRGSIGVLLGRGNGTFKPVLLSEGFTPEGTGLVVADVNSDGKPDVLLTTASCVDSSNCSKGEVGVLIGNGDGTFQSGMAYPWGGWSANGLAVGDFDGDGNLDVAVGGCGSSNCLTTKGRAGLMLGNGDGTFRAGVTYESGGASFVDAVAVADVNGDGKLDVVAANFDFSAGSVGVLLGNGDGTLQPAATFGSGGSATYSVAVRDVNGDGQPDVLVTSCSKNVLCGGGIDGVVAVLLNNSLPPGSTTTTLTSSEPITVYGQKLTLTATVVSSSSVAPTGKVGFRWAGGSFGAAYVNGSGVAVLTRSTLNAGTYAITAVYGGDTVQLGSSSIQLNQVVQQATSAATITSSGSPSLAGQPVTFTATITSPTVKPTGPVTFSMGKTVLGTAQLSGGKAQVTISSLPTGSATITVTFYGDSNIAGSSASLVQTVH